MSHLNRAMLVKAFTSVVFCHFAITASGGIDNNFKKLENSAVAQAEIMAQAFKAGRYDILYKMIPPRLADNCGSYEDYESIVKSSLGNEVEIADIKVGPVLSMSKHKEETFATISSQIHITVSGQNAMINSYIIGISGNDGQLWSFVNGSSSMALKLKKYSPELASRLIFPDITMKVAANTFKRTNEGWVPSDIEIAETADSKQHTFTVKPHILYEIYRGGSAIGNPHIIRVGKSWRVYFSCYYYDGDSDNGIYCFTDASGTWEGRRHPTTLYGSRVLDSVCVKNNDSVCYLSTRPNENVVLFSIIKDGRVASIPIELPGEEPMYPSAVDGGSSGIWFAYRDFKNLRLMFAYPNILDDNDFAYSTEIVDKDNDTGWMCRAARSPIFDYIGIIYTAKTIDGKEIRYAQGSPRAGWTIARIDEADDGAFGSWPELAFSSKGSVACVYNNRSGLHYAYRTGGWNTEQITKLSGRYVAICFDENDEPMVAFYAGDRINGKFTTALYLAIRSNNQWRCIQLDNNQDVENISATGMNPSISTAPNGDLAITYLEFYEKDQAQKHRVKVITLSKAEIDELTK